MVADAGADREAEATSDVDRRPGDERAPVTPSATATATGSATGSDAAHDAGAGTAGDVAGLDAAPVDTSADEPSRIGAAAAAESLPDGPLGARVAALSELDLAARPDAFAELDAAIVAELRAIEDL